jgi:site-specific DNA-methyltransferase (adenine-specific)
MIDLRLGDCLEVMKSLPDKSIDAIICDLPYGTTACKWDSVIPFEPLWEQYKRIIKDNGAILLFGQEPFSSHLRISNISWYKYDWYWEKERLTNVMQVKHRCGKTIETISVFYKNQPIYNPQKTIHNGKLVTNLVKNGSLGTLVDGQGKQPVLYRDDRTRHPTQLLKFKRDILKSNLHPTQKPLALMEYLVKTYTNEGETVLDNCMGSGTTGVACKNLSRKFIGIEQDANYFEIAKNRINERSTQTIRVSL